MLDVTNRKIWVFREARSGSIAFTNWLSRIVNKPMKSVEKAEDIVDDNSVLFHTHNFNLLKELKTEDNPIVFRCSRKDKAEQFLSHLAHDYTKLANVHNETTQEELDHFNAVTQNNKVTVMIGNVLSFLVHYKNDNELWERYSTNFINQTIYYEDGVGNIRLPALGIDDIYYGYGDSRWCQKLPESYKETMFTNGNLAKELVRMYFK